MKVSRTPATEGNSLQNGTGGFDTTQTVVRRAMAICECALGLSDRQPFRSSTLVPPPANAPPPPQHAPPAPPTQTRTEQPRSPPQSPEQSSPPARAPAHAVSVYAESVYDDDPPIPYPGPPEHVSPIMEREEVGRVSLENEFRDLSI